MTRLELCRARHVDVARLASWLGIARAIGMPREDLIDSVLLDAYRWEITTHGPIHYEAKN